MKKVKFLVTSIALSLILTSTCASQVSAKVKYRLGGKNRYDTSKTIANNFAKGKIDNVIIASGKAPYDALSASLFAKNINAPILLADTDKKTCPQVFEYIKKHLNKDGHAYILGGNWAVSKNIENEISKLGYKTERLYGKDRFETNNKILNKLNIKEGTPVFITSSSGFGDSLSVSSLSSINGYPLIMTDKNGISSDLKEKLNKIKPSKVYVIGSKLLIPENIISEIKSCNNNLQDTDILRIFGKNRYETNLLINKAFNLKSSNAVIASGEGFADALTGSTLASKLNAPIILTNGTNFTNQKKYLTSTDYINYYILGLEGSVNKSIEDTLNKSLDLCDQKEFFNKLANTSNPKSFESESKCKIKLSSSNLNGEMHNFITNLTSNLGDTLTVTNKIKNISSSPTSLIQENVCKNDFNGPLSYLASSTSYNWTKVDNDTFKIIYKMPKQTSKNLTSVDPKFNMLKDKEYLILSSKDMNNLFFNSKNNNVSLDEEKLNKTLKDLTPKIQKLAIDFIKNYNPNIEIVKKVPTSKNLMCYQLTLNNKTLKSLMSYDTNNALNFVQSKNLLDLLKCYVNGCIDVSSENKEELKKQFNTYLNSFLNNMPKNMLKINEVVNYIDSLNILGKDGVKINYYLNNEGYLVSTKGTLDLNFDLSKIKTLFNNDTPTNISGNILLNIDFSNNMSNINKNIKVNIPKVNGTNSINYSDLLKSIE